MLDDRRLRFTKLAARVTATADEPPIDVSDPVTGDTIGTVPACSAADVAAAAGRVRAAQRAWGETSFRQRKKVLVRFHDLIWKRQHEILDIIQLENGKTRVQAFEEVMSAANVALHYAYAGRGYLRERRRPGAWPIITQTRELRRPRGVVGFITPWNYPLTMGITDAIAAIAAGNGALIKPDRQTPFSTIWAAALLQQAGLPDDLVEVVTGEGSKIGGAIVENVDYLMFTGSTAVGRGLAKDCADRLIECSMELGGKNAMLVLPDCSVERAVRGAITGSFSSAGQLCISMERIYVHESRFDEFVDCLAERLAKLKLGGGLEWDAADVGPLISQRQLQRVGAHVDDAVANGATLRAGGRARPDIGPLFYEPTVLTGVTPAAACFGEETFGPLVSVYPYEDVDAAVDEINASPYGLNASIWTGKRRVATRLARRIEAGTVNINEGYSAAYGSTGATMGGVKASGMGRRHGTYGIQKYTELQTVASQWIIPVTPPMSWNGRIYARTMTFLMSLKRRIPILR